ncbi:Putative cell wall binding repeat-containing protein, partial [Granulicatella balaenopterae]
MKKISCMVTVGTLLCLATPSVIASEQQAPSTPEPIETVEDTKPVEGVEDTKPVEEGDSTDQEKQKGFVTIANQLYYFDDNGEKVIGFYTIPQTTDMIYTNQEGVVQTGWIQVGEDTYYVDPLTNFLKKSEWFNIVKTRIWYYFKEDGKMARNTIVNDSFVGEDGKMVRNQWVYDSYSGHHFAKENGKLAHNEWVDGSYLKDSGKMAWNEWVEYNGHWYFITPNSVYAHDTWKGEYYLKQ